ncbi:hypothetical protein BGZ61DRAFT_461806 [Ilyonectria robusta]|uniref:uncharacterized protein n=1 Tax=Ilyonectria robusta TaxID=1079257 RepID=UPI001E8D9D9B|nr:uncharacterized protein BGZ61DRAFT_461806 [Ilyonectria robusta]KAH8666269.1 hypothetical protein BGZ61DRAFT_461806 [Ilyonectria robusta]
MKSFAIIITMLFSTAIAAPAPDNSGGSDNSDNSDSSATGGGVAPSGKPVTLPNGYEFLVNPPARFSQIAASASRHLNGIPQTDIVNMPTPSATG